MPSSAGRCLGRAARRGVRGARSCTRAPLHVRWQVHSQMSKPLPLKERTNKHESSAIGAPKKDFLKSIRTQHEKRMRDART